MAGPLRSGRGLRSDERPKSPELRPDLSRGVQRGNQKPVTGPDRSPRGGRDGSQVPWSGAESLATRRELGVRSRLKQSAEVGRLFGHQHFTVALRIPSISRTLAVQVPWSTASTDRGRSSREQPAEPASAAGGDEFGLGSRDDGFQRHGASVPVALSEADTQGADSPGLAAGLP